MALDVVPKVSKKDGRIRRQMVTLFPYACAHAVEESSEMKVPPLTETRQEQCVACCAELVDHLCQVEFQQLFRYFIFQYEVCPESGRCHLQCYFVAKDHHGFSPRKWRNSFNDFGFHGTNFTACNGTDRQCRVYCSKKEEGGWGDFYEYGNMLVNPGQREKVDWEDVYASAQRGAFDEIDPKVRVNRFTTLLAIQKHAASTRRVKDLTTEEFNAPANVWLSGETGIGKSWEARELFTDPDGNPLPYYSKDTTRWWCGYSGEPVVIIEDVCPGSAKDLDRLFKIWSDRYAFFAEVKGGYVPLRPKHIVVTSQYALSDVFTNPETRVALERRFVERHETVPYLQRRKTEVIDLSQDDV